MPANNPKKMRLIGIAGRAHSGKDTVSNYLIEHLDYQWQRSAFADPIKAMLAAIGVDCSDDNKDLIDSRYGVTPRHMMQTLGTEWGRGLIADDIWVKAVSTSGAGRDLIVPDVRRDNEADLIRKHGLLIHLTGRGGIAGTHASEKTLPVQLGDLVIDNSGTLEDLYSAIDINDIADKLHIANTPSWLPF
jgi:hypothetical protein